MGCLSPWDKEMEPAAESLKKDIVAQVVARVADCYDKHDLCCSESICYVLSQAFAGGLSGRDAVRLGAGYCHGMGGAGCSCGALTGAVAMVAFYLSPHSPEGLRKKPFRREIRAMHDQFRQRFHSTCCRVLSKKGEGGSRRFSCLELTEAGAEMATHVLLAARPHLMEVVDRQFLQDRTCSLSG